MEDDDLFDVQKPVAAPEAPEPDEQPEAVEQAPEPEPKPRDDKGRFAKGETEEGSTPEPEAEQQKPDVPDRESGLQAGIIAERRKRQALEARLAELEAAKEQAPMPDVLEDPEGYTRHQSDKFQSALTNERVNLSYAVAKRLNPDFEEVMQTWNEEVERNPALYQAAVQQEMPAEWAYQHCKRVRFMKEVGDDPSAYRQRIESEAIARERAKWESERRPAAPRPSLAATTSGKEDHAVWKGPPPLDSILDN